MFNQNSRTHNMRATSLVGTVCQFLTVLSGFAYRTVFIHVLSSAYLGINGLFSNVFTLLSLAELGIGSSILYRLYPPIAAGDVRQVGRLVNFYGRIYALVAGLVLAAGLALYPFLDALIKDPGQVPPDVNLRLVYLLFLGQSVVSYLFVYRTTLWIADQKRPVYDAVQAGVGIAKSCLQLAVLAVSRDFTLSLLSGIVLTVLVNAAFSCVTTRCYGSVFAVAERLPRAACRGVLKDAGAMALHRFGGAVLGCTDSLVLAKFAGLVATGLYSNYALLAGVLSQFAHRLFGCFAPNYGNAYAVLGAEEVHGLYRRMLFLNLFAAGFVAALFYLLVGGFLTLWIGAEMRLPSRVEAVLAVQLYLTISRFTNVAHIEASGLFVYDKPRPLVEAALNVIVSILLTIRFGIIGVFLGTIISSGLTAFWREPYLLYRHRFRRAVWTFWRRYLLMALQPLGFCLAAHSVRAVVGRSWTCWVGGALGLALAYLICFGLLFGRTEEIRSFLRKRPKR